MNPPIVNFQTQLATTQPCGQYDLIWSTTDATRVSIDQGVGIVSESGQITVSALAGQKTYTITAFNEFGTTTASICISVGEHTDVSGFPSMTLHPYYPVPTYF